MSGTTYKQGLRTQTTLQWQADRGILIRGDLWAWHAGW